MEKVSAVFVHLYPGLRLKLAVGVPSYMRAPLNDCDFAASLSSTLGDSEAEETRTNYKKIGHAQYLLISKVAEILYCDIHCRYNVAVASP